MQSRQKTFNAKLLFWSVVLLTLLVGIPAWPVWREYRQESLNQQLIAAIKAQNTNAAIAALENGANANYRDDGKPPASLQAILRRCWQRLRGIPQSPPTTDPETKPPPPLLLVLSDPPYDFVTATTPTVRENAPLVRALLQHGAATDCRDWGDSTPLHNAVSHHFTESVRLLLEYHADPNALGGTDQSTPLHRADIDCTRLLLAHGAKIEITNRQGETPLLADCELPGQDKSIALLLQQGARANVHDVEGHTPLLYAAQNQSLPTIKLLLAKGADIRARTKQCETALMFGAYSGHPEVVRFLLQQGFDVNARDSDGTTVLLNTDDITTLRLLLEKGADPNLPGVQKGSCADFEGTPLMAIAWSGDKAKMKLLLQYGADINARNPNGDTAMSIATGQHYPDFVRFLKQHGAVR